MAKQKSKTIVSIDTIYSGARNGSPQAEKQLFEKLSARYTLLAQQKIGNPDDAREVVQDALTSVFERYKQIEFESSFAAWAHKVLTNKILAYYKTKSRQRGRTEQLANRGESLAAHSSTPLLEEKLLDCLRRINSVNKQHARVLNLHYQGYSVSEICNRLKLKRSNLYSMLSRARSMLLICLETGRIKL